MKKIALTTTVLIAAGSWMMPHGASASQLESNDSWNGSSSLDSTFAEILEMQQELDLSKIPVIPRRLDKIQELRKMHEEGKLPKDSDAFLTMQQVANKYGFRYEEHQVVTKDGYIITVGRLPGLLSEDTREGQKPPIILQHGLGANMMQWIMNTPETTHALVLARNGYDVWLPNNRGTVFSLGHVSLDAKKDPEYWSWSWEEMGSQDQVAVIEHILQVTGFEKVNYMGHSEGTTQIMAGGSLLPSFFNSRINLAVLLAPPAAMVNCPSKSLQFLSEPKIMDFIDKAAKKLFILDFLPYNLFVSEVASKFCSLLDGWMCELIYAASQGSVVEEADNMDRLSVYMSYEPTDAGAFNFEHYGQNMHTADGLPVFQRYDHGKEVNMQKYGQPAPPHYNLTNLQFPIAIFYGTYDDLANTKDVAWLYNQIQDHVVHYEELPFGHLSFQVAKNMTYFTSTTMDILAKYNNGAKVSQSTDALIPESINPINQFIQ